MKWAVNLLLLLPSASALVPSHNLFRAGWRTRSSARAAALQATAAGDVLNSARTATVGTFIEKLGMQEKDYPAELGFDSFSLGGGAGTLHSYEAVGAANVAWCSSLSVDGDDSCLSSLTCWCGPMTDVPHLVGRGGQDSRGGAMSPGY